MREREREREWREGSIYDNLLHTPCWHASHSSALCGFFSVLSSSLSKLYLPGRDLLIHMNVGSSGVWQALHSWK